MKIRFALWVALACAAAGCSNVPVAMRADITTIPIDQHLAGMSVAVSKVRDLRADRATLGKHRDGLARVTQYEYAAAGDVRGYVKKLAELSMLARGGKLTAPADADVRVEIDILAIDLTTDGALAGEETFGAVQMAFRFLDRDDKLIGESVVKRPFRDEELDDRGLVGDALKEAVLSAIAKIHAPREERTADTR